MKYFLYAIVLFGYFVLPVVVSILGSDVEYDSDSSDPKQLIFRMVCFMIVAYFYLRGSNLYPCRYYSFGYFASLLFVAIFAFEYTFLSGNFHDLALYAFEVFFVYSIPGILMAIDMVYERDSLLKVFRNVHLLMYVVSLGSIMAIPKTLAAGVFMLGDTSYQTFSYSLALCFGINLFGILFKQDAVFDIFKTKTARWLSIILLPIQAVCVFLGGGRGGAILLIVSLIVLVIISNIVKGVSLWSVILKMSIYAIIIVTVIATVLQYNPDLNEQLFHFDRVFEYISDSGGIDMDGSSGRDTLYKIIWGQIQLSPICGYGIFRSYGFYGKSHNMFLDFLLAGGILLFAVIVLVFVHFFVKIYKMCKTDNCYICLIPLTLFSFVMLQFSGSYLFTPMFWFVLTFVLLFKNKGVKSIVLENLK